MQDDSYILKNSSSTVKEHPEDPKRLQLFLGVTDERVNKKLVYGFIHL